MKQNTLLIISSILALALAGGMVIRVSLQKRQFDHTVRESLKTSEGYDKKLVTLVNHLEEELASRASFGYKGSKDPMTGKTRKVVLPVRKTPKAVPRAEKSAPVKPPDPVKLTAIIYDDEGGKYTAIVMDGERSYSVEVGDNIRGRTIRRINAKVLWMDDKNMWYGYDIWGRKSKKKK